MYDDLISSLRICGRINSANDNCIAFHDGSCEAEPVCMYELIGKAANVIEELSKQHEQQRQNLIELMNERPRWIPVTERLPDQNSGSLYICLIVGGEYDQLSWYELCDFAEGQFWIKDELYEGHVTHWMPLPEPPEEGE